MSPRSLPERPNLAHLKHQAKDLLKSHRAADADALARIRQSLPRCQGHALDAIARSQFQLSDALFVIAREYGFNDWPALKAQLANGGEIPTLSEQPVDLEPFKAAVEKGDADDVRRQLGQSEELCALLNAPVFAMDAPAIVYARCHRAMVDVLLEFGADINARGQFWGRSLSVLDDVDSETAEYLIGRGAVPQLAAFSAAVRQGDAVKTRKLLAKNPVLKEHINRPLFSFGARPVNAARDHIEVVDVLMEYGADINLKSDWWAGGYSVLDDVEPQVADALIARGAEVDINAAAHLGRVELVRQLLDEDPARVHLRGGDGRLPLHVASTLEIVDLLLDRNADIDARCVDHVSTAAQYAVDLPWKCRRLIERGSTIDIFMAIMLGDMGLVERALAEHPGCATMRVGQQGYPPVPSAAGGTIYQWKLPASTPHELARLLGHEGIYERLMKETPPVERFSLACAAGDEDSARAMLADDSSRLTELVEVHPELLAEAAWSNRLAAVRLLLHLGFPVDEAGGTDGSPLNRACICGYVEVARQLIAHGASLTLRNVYGGVPLEACIWGSLNFRARDGDYPATAETLLSAGALLPDVPAGSAEVQEVLRRHRPADDSQADSSGGPASYNRKYCK
jgi:ankyrin repeat protein